MAQENKVSLWILSGQVLDTIWIKLALKLKDTPNNYLKKIWLLAKKKMKFGILRASPMGSFTGFLKLKNHLSSVLSLEQHCSICVGTVP